MKIKRWQRPAAVGQAFAANDYVSACTLQIMCATTLPNGADSVRLLKDNTVDFDNDGTVEYLNKGFMACGTLHNPSTDTEFFYYEFKSGWTPSNTTTDFEEPVKLAWWREVDEKGNVVDVHITDPANITNAVANKS